MNNKPQKLNRKREDSHRRSSSLDPRPMVTMNPSNTTDRGSFSHRQQTIDSQLQKRVDDEDCDGTHVSPTNGMNFEDLSSAVSCAADMLQSVEHNRIPRRRSLPKKRGSSTSVQRHMSCSGPESTSKLDLRPPISITSANTASENDTKELHPSKAESSEVKSSFRHVLTRRQVAALDDPAVTSAAKRKTYNKTDSRIVRSLRRSFQTCGESNGSIERDKNHNSTTVAKSMMSFIEGKLPPTTGPSKQRVVSGSEKRRRPPKPLPPLPPLSREEAKRRRQSRRSGSGPSPFQLDQSCKDSIRHLSRKSESGASPFELDQESYNDDFPPCSFHGPCEEDSHAIFNFKRICTTTIDGIVIDGIVHLSLPIKVEGPRSQRRTRSVDSKSRQRSNLGSKATRSKSSSRSCSKGDENKSLPGVPPRPKKSTEKQSYTEGTGQRSRSPGAKDDSPVTSSSLSADYDVVVTSSREVDRHSRRRSTSIDGGNGRNASNQKNRSGPSRSGYLVEAAKDDEVKTNHSSASNGVSLREDRPEGVSPCQRSGSIGNSLLQRNPSSNKNSGSRRRSIDQSIWKATTWTTQKSRTNYDSNDEKPNVAISQHPEQGKPSQESSKDEISRLGNDARCIVHDRLRDCHPGIVSLPLIALHRLGDGDSAVAREIKRTGKITLDQRIDRQEASAISPVPATKNSPGHSNKSEKVDVLRKHTEDSLTPPTSAFVKASKKSKSHQTSTRHGPALEQDDCSLSTNASSLSGASESTRSREKLRRRDSFNGFSAFANLEERSNGVDAVVSFNKDLFVSSSMINTKTFVSHSIDVEDPSVSTTTSKASGGSTNQGHLGGVGRHTSLNGAEEVASIDFSFNRSDRSTHNQRPRRAAGESSSGKVERSDRPGLGSSCSSFFGNGTKPNRKKTLQRSSVQLVPVLGPEERFVSTSASIDTCTKMGRQKSNEGSVALDLDSALPGIDCCHSAEADFNKSPADEMQVSISAVESNKEDDLRQSSIFDGSDAVAILNKSSSDLYCFTTGALYASEKKSTRPARRRSFNGPPSVAADSNYDGFSGVFVPVSRIYF
jgi:hypothetical protein